MDQFFKQITNDNWNQSDFFLTLRPQGRAFMYFYYVLTNSNPPLEL